MKTPLFLLILALVSIDAYHILVLSPVPSKSHNALGRGIVDALLKAGHEVSWATPWPPKTPTKGLNIIDVSVTIPVGEFMMRAVNIADRANSGNDLKQILSFSTNITKAALHSPALRDAVIKGNYDAVVTEWFFSDYEAGYAAILKVPWILMRSIPMEPTGEEIIDEVRSVSTIPNLMFNFASIPMSFYERCKNTLSYLLLMFSQLRFSSHIEAVYNEEFGPLARARGVELPELQTALHNVSILLSVSDPSFTPAHSVPPNVVSIAGHHINENIPPLPKDLQDLLDNSPQGVIYFSMGSILKSASFPAKLRAELLEMFSSLKQTVLWKFEEQLENLPPNVHVRPWMPQASILSHPNIRVFITHGGMLSHLEALHCGVPLLSLPVFGDQPTNAFRAVINGYGRKVSFSTEMVDTMTLELKEMLQNDSYLKRAKYISKLFRNRLVSPSKLISYHVELAIETKGAYHLRSPSKLYSWHQRWMLDQLLALTALVYVIYKVLKTICKAICGKRNNNTRDIQHKRKQKRH